MEKMKVRITFVEPVLGTQAGDPEVHRSYIASKAPDAASKEEEVAAIGIEGVEKKEMSVFPRLEDGTPFIWDYQWRGFFKDSCSALQKSKDKDVAKESMAIKAFKKVIDGNIFVDERRIPIDIKGTQIGKCERPLRASTVQGERIALASSEQIEAGSTCEFTITTLGDFMPAVIEWLNYGRYRGMLQWRNSGMGRFTWEKIDD